jgi:hypothetical protein
MDYEQEQLSEIELLRTVYPDELEVLSDVYPGIKLKIELPCVPVCYFYCVYFLFAV